MISWVVDILYDQYDITPSMIHKSFKATRANTNIDGSEDMLITENDSYSFLVSNKI